MTTVDMNTSTVITDEMVARVRRRIGEEVELKHGFNTEAQRDNIRHWADGIGDLNPLWLDEDYTRKTQYGTILAPPSFLYTCNQGPAHRGAGSGGFRGFPGVHRFWAQEVFEWYRPIYLGDQIKGTVKIAELNEHKSSLAKRAFEDIRQETYKTGKGELIAVHRSHFFNTERGTAAKTGKHKEFQVTKYTPAELDKIWEDIQKEEIRGAKPRYWEDVNVGDTIPHVVKGPYTSSDAVAFVAGWGGPFIMSAEVTWRYIKAHPKANVPVRATNAPDFPERAHWDDAFAREVGAPAAYDFGGQRTAWMMHGLTNWAGDDGFLRYFNAKLIKFNVTGDTTWCRGKVTGKSIDGGEHLVSLEIWGENQRGEVTVSGEARVRLPSRG